MLRRKWSQLATDREITKTLSVGRLTRKNCGKAYQFGGEAVVGGSAMSKIADRGLDQPTSTCDP